MRPAVTAVSGSTPSPLEHVPAKTGPLAVDARPRATLAKPPLAEVAESHARICGQRLQAEALPLGAPFELVREPPRFGLAPSRRDLVAPAAIRTLPAQVPLVRLLVDARHRC